jgi:hypothetical protein
MESMMRESGKSSGVNTRVLALIVLLWAPLFVTQSSAQDSQISKYVHALRRQREAMLAVSLNAADTSQRIVEDKVINAEGSSRYDVLIDFRTQSCRIDWTSSYRTILNGVQSSDNQTELIVTPDRYFRASETAQSPLSVSSRLLPSESGWKETVTGFPIFAMFGYLPVDQCGGSLIELLNELKDVELNSERVDDAACTVISGTIDDGELRVWFDGDHGNLVRRLVFHRTSPNPDFLMDSYEYDVLKVQDVADTVIPEEFRVTNGLPSHGKHQFTLEPGLVVDVPARPATRDVFEYTIESVSIALDCTESDFAPRFEIPNGTPVRMSDLSLRTPLKFEWRDGEILSLPE